MANWASKCENPVWWCIFLPWSTMPWIYKKKQKNQQNSILRQINRQAVYATQTIWSKSIIDLRLVSIHAHIFALCTLFYIPMNKWVVWHWPISFALRHSMSKNDINLSENTQRKHKQFRCRARTMTKFWLSMVIWSVVNTNRLRSDAQKNCSYAKK